MKIKMALFATICTIMLMSTVSLVYAAPAAVAQVWTTNGANLHTAEFHIGELVKIWWTPSPSSGTVDISVIGPNGAPVTLSSSTNLPSTASGTVTFTTSLPGIYKIHVNGQTTDIAVGGIFVLPESALGTLMAISACIGAVGVFKIAKVNRPKTTN